MREGVRHLPCSWGWERALDGSRLAEVQVMPAAYPCGRSPVPPLPVRLQEKTSWGWGSEAMRLIYLRLVAGLLVGYIFRGPDGAPWVKISIRPKTVVFRVSEPAKPWAKNRHQNRNLRNWNPRISAPPSLGEPDHSVTSAGSRGHDDIHGRRCPTKGERIR